MIKIKTREKVEQIINDNNIKIPTVLELKKMTKRQLTIFLNKCKKYHLFVSDIDRYYNLPRQYFANKKYRKKKNNNNVVLDRIVKLKNPIITNITLPKTIKEMQLMDSESFINLLIELKHSGLSTIDIANKYNIPKNRLERILAAHTGKYKAMLLNKKHPIRLTIEEISSMNYDELCVLYNELKQYGWSKSSISRYYDKGVTWFNLLLAHRRKGHNYRFNKNNVQKMIYDDKLVDEPLEVKKSNRWWYIAAAVFITALTIAALV